MGRFANLNSEILVHHRASNDFPLARKIRTRFLSSTDDISSACASAAVTGSSLQGLPATQRNCCAEPGNSLRTARPH